MDMLCFTKKAAGKERKKQGGQDKQASYLKKHPYLWRKSYTYVISFGHQIKFFKLIDTDRQNISSEFIPQMLSEQQPVSHFLSLSKYEVY